ncbi:MAG: protein phosphatase CheZ, partial [Alphaproteobacteria bacterium]|nr:protein phosphatase CheZ [Alphaproteobacteria bacterium]
REAIARALAVAEEAGTAGNSVNTSGSADHVPSGNLALEKIQEAVAVVVRDELNNWSKSQATPSLSDEESPASAVSENQSDTTQDIMRELAEIQSYIATTKVEIAALKPSEEGVSQLSSAKQELQGIVEETARATNEILSHSERVMEISGTLAGLLTDNQPEAIGQELDALNNIGTEIMIACGFQDLTGQRVTKVVNTLIFIEERINSLLELWKVESGTGQSELLVTREDDARPDKELLNGPQSDGQGISQEDIDAMFS